MNEREQPSDPSPCDAQSPAFELDAEAEPSPVAQTLAETLKAILNQAPQVVQALLEKAKQGDLAAAKYLFEQAGIRFEHSPEGAAHARSLAKMLLERLNQQNPSHS